MIPNVQKPSAPCFNIQIDFFFCRDHCICLSLPLSAFPVSSCVFFFLFCFVFRDVLLPSQRLLLPLSWITSGDEFSLNYYMGDRELLCSATTIFSPVMGTLSPAADLQHTSPLISASFMLLVPFLTLQWEWEEHLLDCDKWCPAVPLLWYQNFTIPFNDTVQHAFLSSDWDWGDKDLSSL